jgi:SpoVK/Ycf46/Vps4 family AAA+-type ATPase
MPSLVRESSMKMGIAGIVHATLAPAKALLVRTVCPSRNDVFGSIVLPAQLEADIRSAARSIANAKRNQAPLRHMMFHGPPGTGKTMAAQLLARHCGLDYAIMSGGDVAPLGAQAVEELHKLFTWAKTSKRGLLLFIDEAEAFLGSRGRGNVSEHLRNVLSALLYQTGTQSQHYMLILATNRPQELDSAVLDRVDVSMYFPVPDATQRLRLVHRYLSEHILARCSAHDAQALSLAAAMIAGTDSDRLLQGPSKRAGKDKKYKAGPKLPQVQPVQEQVGAFISEASGGCFSTKPLPIKIASTVSLAMIDRIVSVTEGFSGRAISKLLLNIQGDIYATEDCELTSSILENALNQAEQRFSLRRSGDAFEAGVGTASKRSSTPEPHAGEGIGSDAYAHPLPAATSAHSQRRDKA